MVDENLFLYDLAVVTIMKNEAPYVKEWLDYHLLAGVDHFYIYDNESSDNLKEVLQPYIDAGIVTYTFYPGKCRQLESYIDAVKRFRFFCRYMAWIDADEFIFPKSKPTITETVDEILSDAPQPVSGLAVNLNAYGSGGYEKADLSCGVLERFTRRAENDWTPPLTDDSSQHGGNAHVSTIANPRRVKFFPTPHAPIYFSVAFAVNENRKLVQDFSNYPVSTEKIVMNHYSVKSKEEYIQKISRGNADLFENNYDMDKFNANDRNEVFDDSILNYYDARLDSVFQTYGDIENYVALKKVQTARILKALQENLNQIFNSNNTVGMFKGKLDNFLTCLSLTEHFKGSLLTDDEVKRCEELSLNGVGLALLNEVTLFDLELLLKEMPKILLMPYPAVKEICKVLLDMIPQIMLYFRMQNAWQQFTDLEHDFEMLKSFYAVMYK